MLECLVENQCLPTYRELGVRFGIKSPNGVACHLKALAAKGYVAPAMGKNRAYRLLGVRLRAEVVE
jgi:repressor LexA